MPPHTLSFYIIFRFQPHVLGSGGLWSLVSGPNYPLLCPSIIRLVKKKHKKYLWKSKTRSLIGCLRLMWQTRILQFILSSLPPISKNVNAVLSRISQQLYINTTWIPFRMLMLSSTFALQTLLWTRNKGFENPIQSCWNCQWRSRLPLWFPLPSPSQKRFVITFLCFKGAFSTGYLGHHWIERYFFKKHVFFLNFQSKHALKNNLSDLIFWRFSYLQGKCSASSKDSSLFGVSFSELVKADFSSSALRCKVVCNNVNYFFLCREK